MRIRNVYEIIEKNWGLWRDRVAIIGPSPGDGRLVDEMTYGAVMDQIHSVALALTEKGVKPGHRILMLIPMSVPLYVSMLAVIKMGAVAVFVDPHMKAKQFDACCRTVSPRAFFGIPKAHLYRLFCKNVRSIPLAICVDKPFWLPALSFNSLLGKSGTPATHLGEKNDPALIGFTTGSSGTPKGSMRTHEFLMGQLEALNYPENKTRMASNFPGFPVLTLEDLAHGRTVILPRFKPGKVGDADPRQLIQQINRHRPQMMSGSPAYLENIADAALKERIKLPSIELLYTGGAPISAKALKKVLQVWDNADVYIVYGSTEAEPVSCIRAKEVLEETYPLSCRGRGNCVGAPISQIDLLILPLDHREHRVRQSLDSWALPAGEVGEVVVKGLHVNTRYWNNPRGERENKIAAPEGIWHRMGDAGYLDEKGRLWIVGRKHSSLKKTMNGEVRYFFPYQVEAILDDMPAIQKSACLQLSGGNIVAVLKPAETGGSIDLSEMKNKINGLIPGLELDRIWIRNHLPLDPRHNSKVDYGNLRRELEGSA